MFKKTQIKENFEDEFRPKNFYLIITAVGCGTSRTPSPTVGAEPNCTLYPFAFFGLRRMNAHPMSICLMATRYVDLAAYGQVGFPRGLLLVADEGVPH